MRDRPVVLFIALGVLLSVAGVALGLAIDWFPEAASEQAGPIDTLYDVLIIASVPIFVGVTGFIVFCVRTFKERPETAGTDGPPIHGDTRLEIIWTVIPAVMMIGLCAYAYVVLRDIEEEPATAAAADQQEMRIGVVGEQFTWTFTYPKEITGGKPIVSPQLYLPQGRSVDFRINAKDVLHDFWVPEFRMKIDAVPGQETGYRVTPTKRGIYPVVCAELCGLGHSVMRSTVRVVTPKAFAIWLEQQGKPAVAAGAGPDELATAGKKVFIETGCGSCHALADAGTNGAIGPNMDVVKGQSVAEVRESIVKPAAKISKGFPPGVMPPNYGQELAPEELDALVTYLRKTAGS